MTNQEKANRYLNWISQHYQEQKTKLSAFCRDKQYKFDEDIFSDTYIKVYDKILKHGIKDDSEKGFDNYTFISFKVNTMREGQYSRNQKRDDNVANIPAAYEAYLNTKLTKEEKLKADLYKDFATLYILLEAEKNFEPSDLRLFKIKLFDGLTYKQLADKTKEPCVRQRVVAIKNFIKEHITKKDIDEAFESEYGNLVM